MDVRDLIENYSAYESLFRIWLETYRRPNAGSRIMAELSIVSGRQELWDAYCCVLGYSESEDVDPNEVLRNLPFDGLLLGEIAWDDVDFLNYSQEFRTVEPDAFLGAAFALRLVLAEDSIEATPDMLECIRGCNRQYDDNRQARQKCIDERCLGIAG